jgi:fermentation-respiration switch protein FrsA (DUF1100 family)
MRQSLSENRRIAPHPPEPPTRNWPAAGRAVYLAVALPAILVVAAIIDQAGSRSLADHVTAMYAPYGKQPDPNLLYGLVYTVAAAGALLWLPVIRAVRSRHRSAPVLAVIVTTITAALALLLLASTEYGAQIFPPLWGILAILPPAAGAFAVVLLRRRRAHHS